MKIADDTFLGNSECEWVNCYLEVSLRSQFAIYYKIKIYDACGAEFNIIMSVGGRQYH